MYTRDEQVIIQAIKRLSSDSIAETVKIILIGALAAGITSRDFQIQLDKNKE